jgi:ComF family protein
MFSIYRHQTHNNFHYEIQIKKRAHLKSNRPLDIHKGLRLIEAARTPSLKLLSQLVSNARFLLVQERCRICDRFIHPEIPHFDYANYAPPGRYLINGKKKESEAVCRSCCRAIRFSTPIWRNILTGAGGRVIRALPVFSGAKFDGDAKTLIHAFKYDADILLEKDLTVLAWRAWRLLTRTTPINKWNSPDQKPLLVPVPLHWWRERRRGFNQSEMIAKGLANATGLKLSSKALMRDRNTAPQQKLSREERTKNLHDAFWADHSIVKGKTIILIDDVCTTGATLIECAYALRNAGATNVLALTLATVELNNS